MLPDRQCINFDINTIIAATINGPFRTVTGNALPLHLWTHHDDDDSLITELPMTYPSWNARYQMIVIPQWVPFIPATIPATLAIGVRFGPAVAYAGRNGRGENRCAVCGYDLRAHAGALSGMWNKQRTDAYNIRLT